MSTNTSYFVLGLSVILIILIGGCVQQENFESERFSEYANQSDAVIPEPITVEGLGTLCYNKEECTSFCQNNRGRCEEYCRVNENELCSTIFSPDKQSELIVDAKPGCISNPSPVFTSPFTDITKIREISPIGNVDIQNPGSRARSYVTINPGTSEGLRELVPIYAPIDSEIFRIAYVNRNYGNLGTRAEYSLNFRVSCEVTYTFDHISNVVDAIKKIAPTDTSSRNDILISYPVKAGQLIGHTDGTFVAGGFDFMVLNTAHQEKYINPSRWLYDHSKYGVCPYDFFTPQLKEKYYSLLKKTRSSDSKASCRNVSRDIVGTLSGGWFQENSTDKSGVRLAIATVSTDMIDLRIMRNDQSTLFRDYTHPDVLKPEDVTVGKSVCYYDKDRNIFAHLKLLSENEMGLVLGNGSCLSSFTQEYELFKR